MRKFTSPIALLALLFAGATLAVADHHEGHGDKTKFFDMEKCTICKCMGEHKDLMMQVKWETHLIDNGILMMSVVPEDLQEKMGECCDEMKATAEKLMTGQIKGEMCGFCQAYGGLVGAGANVEEVKTAVGQISLLTSDDATTVKKIHEFGKVTQEETKKMEEMMEGTADLR